MSKKYVRPADFIVPLNINGLEGRMINVDGDSKHKKNEILIVYDLNSNLERWWGLVVGLKRYGNVIMADLPGFGGMDSFFSISSKPTIDNLADYLATVIKLKYNRKRLNIFGIGFGFVVVTRMLQRNPDLRVKVKIVVSINGYSHKDDFINFNSKKIYKDIYYYLGSTYLGSFILDHTINNRLILGYRFKEDETTSSKQKALNSQFISRFKVDLYKENDLRTRNFIQRQILNLDNCNIRLSVPMWHITFVKNIELSSKLVEQHFKIIFKDFNYQKNNKIRKVPFVFTDDKLAIKLIPAKLRREFKKL